MAASTPEEFADDLYESMQWRRSELASLRTTIERLSSQEESKPHGRMLLRAGVALVYAHWEGYTKQACQHYLDYVARRRLKYSELNEPFLLTSLRPIAQRASQGGDDLSDLAVQMMAGGTGRARVPRSGIVETGSNLRHDRLVGILESIGLDASPFAVRRQLIDQRLCDARNEITHGQESYPSRDSLLELGELVFEMMEQIQTQLLDAVFTSQYRRAVDAG